MQTPFPDEKQPSRLLKKFGFILRQAQDEVECFQRVNPHGELVEPWAACGERSEGFRPRHEF
jgi:hypothetical protein